MNSKYKQFSQRGFTLIEIMVVVVIVKLIELLKI